MSSQTNQAMEFSATSEFRARSYQLEMLEQSFNRNVIIAVRVSENNSSLEADIECRWIPGAARLKCEHFEPSLPA